MFECGRAHKVWENLGLLEKVEKALNFDMASSAVLDELICSSSDDPLYLAQIPVPCLIAVASWFLWWERRQCAKGEKITMPDRSALSIQALALNFHRAATIGHPAKDVMWARPPLGTVKLNVDASFEYEGNMASTGVILRDDAGDLMTAEICYLRPTIDAYTAEALAMKKGLQLADSLGIHDILVCEYPVFPP